MKEVLCHLPQSPSFLDIAMLTPLQKMAGADSEKHSNEIEMEKKVLF